MRSGHIQYGNIGASGYSHAARKNVLPLVGIGCLGLALAGCSGTITSIPTAEQDHAQTGNLKTQHYTIQDLGVVGANPSQPGQPLVIANNGLVSGAAGVGTAEHAVLWRDGTMIDIGNPGLGGNSMAYGVNEFGLASGEAEFITRGLSTKEDFCGFQAMGYSSSPAPCVPFIWDGRRMYPLETLGGVNGVANGINSGGAITGYAETRNVDPNCTAPQKYQFKPVIWSLRGVHELSTGHDADGVAFGINDRGDAVGASGSCAPFNPIWLFNLNPTHALLWRDGLAIDLGNLGGAMNNLAHDVNNLDQVVGGSDLAGDETSHAFLWTQGSKMQDLGTLSGDFFSFGLGINDAGQVVGLSANADFSVLRAFVRQNSTLVDLNTLVTGNNSLFLMTACSINSQGQIIGLALDPNTGETHGYMASPAS